MVGIFFILRQLRIQINALLGRTGAGGGLLTLYDDESTSSSIFALPPQSACYCRVASACDFRLLSRTSIPAFCVYPDIPCCSRGSQPHTVEYIQRIHIHLRSQVKSRKHIPNQVHYQCSYK